MSDRDNDLDPPFCRRGLLMGASRGAVDHLDLAVMGGGDGVHHSIPHTCFSPSREAVVAGRARAIAIGQVTPRRTGSQHPEDAVQHTSVIYAGHASRLVGQLRLDHAPFEVSQVISAHAGAESVFRLRVKPGLAKGRVSRQLQRMDPTAFVAQIRDHYVNQFRAFAEQQRASCTRGASEVKIQLSEQSELFDRLYCVDFIKNDGVQEIVELQPENILTFEPIIGTFGKASLSIEHLRWDDVLIRHDVDAIPCDPLSHWFQLWFDPEDERHDPNAELSGIIHSMLFQAHCVSIDFGSASPDAFWDILQLLEDAGASRIEVSCSRVEAPTGN